MRLAAVVILALAMPFASSAALASSWRAGDGSPSWPAIGRLCLFQAHETADDAEADSSDASVQDDEPSADPFAGEQLEFDSYLEDPQAAARKGLADASQLPWYSASEDRAVPLGLKKGTEPYPDGVDPGNRATDWLWKSSNRKSWNWNFQPLFDLPLTQLVWVLLVLAAILLAGLLLFALLRARGEGTDKSKAGDPFDEEEDPIAVQERIERLPFELRHGVVDFLDEARRLAAAGKYEEALVYLFSHALVQLDRAHRIRLAKGKTNRQYVGEVASSPPLARLLGDLADDFERVFFGKYRLSQAKYEENLERIERFRQLLQKTADA